MLGARSDEEARTGAVRRNWLQQAGFDCGYDARGAEDEFNAHKLNALRSHARRSDSAGSRLAVTQSLGPRAENVDDIAVVEDDGTIVVPPNKFNLKKRSLLFTPDVVGYRIARSDISFETDRGSKLGFFFGADGKPGSGNNGYRDVVLPGASFPFYGVAYDTVYVGTNG